METIPKPKFTIATDATDEAGGDRYHESTAPAWTAYASEARRLVGAMIALGVIE